VSNLGRWVFARDGSAVASVLFAVAGLIGFGVILGPIAIGLGVMGRRNILYSGKPGMRLAWAGIIIGMIATIVPFVLYSF
jgi:hypothetical protein